MGAWTFMDGRLRELVRDRGLDVRYIGRADRSSPAEGSLDLHLEEQARIVGEAFADVPELATSGRARGSVKDGARVANGAHVASVDGEPVKNGATKAAVKSSASKSRS
jgi:hypothetical protein